MRLSKVNNKIMIRLSLIILSVLLIEGCKFMAMTLTDHIRVINTSELELDILINHHYPDTTYQNTDLNSYISPKDKGGLVLVNRKWDDYLKEREKVTVFFAERKPSDNFYITGRKGEQRIYGKLILSQAKLDSLGGVITFPDDAILNVSEWNNMFEKGDPHKNYDK